MEAAAFYERYGDDLRKATKKDMTAKVDSLIEECASNVVDRDPVPQDVDATSFLRHLIALNSDQERLREELAELRALQRVFAVGHETETDRLWGLLNDELKQLKEEARPRLYRPSEADLLGIVDPGEFHQEKPKKPAMKKPGLFNKKKVEAENEALLERYESQVSEYQRAKEEHVAARNRYVRDRRAAIERGRSAHAEREHERLATVLPEIASTEKRIKALESNDATDASLPELEPYARAVGFLDEECRRTEELLKATVEARVRLENTGVVYGKYLNLPALTTMHEYLITGRCSGLTGPDGAYNLFESELRQNTIIAQLKDVNERLDQIERTQYGLYNEVKRTNSLLADLSEKTDRAIRILSDTRSATRSIEGSTQMIAYQAARAAHFAEVQTHLTDALGFLVAMK